MPSALKSVSSTDCDGLPDRRCDICLAGGPTATTAKTLVFIEARRPSGRFIDFSTSRSSSLNRLRKCLKAACGHHCKVCVKSRREPGKRATTIWTASLGLAVHGGQSRVGMPLNEYGLRCHEPISRRHASSSCIARSGGTHDISAELETFLPNCAAHSGGNRRCSRVGAKTVRPACPQFVATKYSYRTQPVF